MSALRVSVRRCALALATVTVGLCTGACAESDDATAASEQAAGFNVTGRTYRLDAASQYELPDVLREISGLALANGTELYGHNDEQAIIYQIDYRGGRILRRFALEGGLRADFEGIAWLAGRLYLTTSAGQLFELHPGAANAVVPYQVHTSGLDCEVEGLTGSSGQTGLIAACKNRPGGKKALHLHDWRPGSAEWSEAPAIRIRRSQFDAAFARLNRDRPEKFQPTAITTTPEGHLLMIAGPQKVLLEFTAEGVPLAAALLDPKRHPQPEGIAMTAAGTLIIADEGDNKGANRFRGRLTIYQPDSLPGLAQ